MLYNLKFTIHNFKLIEINEYSLEEGQGEREAKWMKGGMKIS